MDVRRSSLDFTGHSLLAVFAHPDDESLASGGLLACCSALGAKVSLLCATRGELGIQAALGVETSSAATKLLGELREKELRAAATVLDIADLVLLDYKDGMLPWTDTKKLENDICNTIRRNKPSVVITFGTDGLYWHPDHIAIHHRTTAAVEALGKDAPALYYVTIPPGQMRRIVTHATHASSAIKNDTHKIFGITNADAFGSLAEPPSLIVQTGVYARKKLAAIKCHISQLDGSAFLHMNADDAPQLLDCEHYRLASIGSRLDSFIEDLSDPKSSK